jgi:hypothetical protein
MRALVLALLFFLAACTGIPQDTTEGTALDALEHLQTAFVLTADYDRDEFGPAWKDTDHNGCDNRSDVMRRDIDIQRTKEFTHGCIVQIGELHNVYKGVTTPYVRGNDSGVEVDHVVSLHNGWGTGLDDDPEQRVLFANDPLNLITTDRATNRLKSDKAADLWLVPDNPGYRCEFAARQVSVKKKYSLSVTQGERQALRDALHDCMDQPLISDTEVAPPRAFPIGEPRR